jgi:hypothetical protein
MDRRTFYCGSGKADGVQLNCYIGENYSSTETIAAIDNELQSYSRTR